MCQLEAAWRTRRVRWVSSACQGLSEAVPELEPSASGRKSTNLDDIYDSYAKGPCFILSFDMIGCPLQRPWGMQLAVLAKVSLR